MLSDFENRPSNWQSCCQDHNATALNQQEHGPISSPGAEWFQMHESLLWNNHSLRERYCPDHETNCAHGEYEHFLVFLLMSNVHRWNKRRLQTLLLFEWCAFSKWKRSLVFLFHNYCTTVQVVCSCLAGVRWKCKSHRKQLNKTIHCL